jgi:subtilisin family serine protease
VSRSSWGPWALCLLLGVGSVGWAQGKAAPKPKLGPPVKLVVGAGARIAPTDESYVASAQTRIANPEPGAPEPVAPPAAATMYTVVHAEFATAEACAQFQAPNVHVITRHSRWGDYFIPSGDAAALKAVTGAQGVVWVDIGRRVTLPPPPTAQPAASRAPAEPIVRGGLNGLTGKGTIIAIVDSGIDFRHPDFITVGPDGKRKSRIIAYWDTIAQPQDGKPGKPGPIAYPNGAPIGTVYTQEDFTNALNASSPTIPQLDTNGHGTSCAGIAAGNGTALPDRRYIGVAPAADIIGVRIGPGPNLPNTYLIGAICDWIDSVAGATPTVISCSFGGQYAGRDGHRVQERQFSDRFNLERKGRVICIAAGNEASSPLHAETTYAAESAPGRLTWNIPSDASGGSLEIYFDDPNPNVTLRTTADAKFKPSSGRSYRHALTKQIVWSIDLPTGPGELQIFSPDGKAGKLDAYIAGFGGKTQSAFTGACLSTAKQVGTPGTTPNAITVGSYDWNNELDSNRGKVTLGDVVRRLPDGKPSPLIIGGLSSYSNPGFSRLGGVVKPEITAPGQFHIAAALTTAPENSLLHTSGKYRPFNGTSAATPYVAGLLALALEKKPTASVGELRDAVKTTASQDRFTGPVPNAKWGHGKLDLAAARKLLDNVR